MEIHGRKERLSVKGADVSGSVFDDVNMLGWTAHNANLSGLRIDDANLAGLQVTNANLAGASISGSRIEGMTIDGINVLDAIKEYRKKSSVTGRGRPVSTPVALFENGSGLI